MQHTAPDGRRWMRGLATLLFVAVTALAIIDTLAWLRLERLLDRRVTSFTERAAQAGWSVQAHRGRRGGWPFAAELSITGLRLAAERGASPAPLEWSGDRVDLSLSPLHPGVLHVALPGTQSLQLGSVALRGWGSGLALESDGQRIVLRADALHLARAGAGPDDVLRCAGARAELHWRPTQPGGTDLSVTLQEPAMPLPGVGGARIAERARLVATFEGLPEAALWGSGGPGGQPDAAAMMSRWAGTGGAIRLDEASLDWVDAGLFLSGRLVPDASGTFGGALSLVLDHPERPLGLLRQSGIIGAGQETAILAVLGLVAAGQASRGADGKVSLPLQMRHGVLKLGDIPLLAIPAL